MEQNTWESLCEDTYKQVWSSRTLCALQQEANAVSLAQELYWCIDWCLITVCDLDHCLDHLDPGCQMCLCTR